MRKLFKYKQVGFILLSGVFPPPHSLTHTHFCVWGRRRRSRWLSGRMLSLSSSKVSGGHVLMGLPSPPVSARISHSIYCLGRLVISSGQHWHRALLPHSTAEKDFYTRAAFFFFLHTRHLANSLVQACFNMSRSKE